MACSDGADSRGNAPGQTTARLLLSQIEIERVLRTLEQDRAVILTDLGEEQQLFASCVLAVDPDGGYFVVAYSPSKAANIALLRQPKVIFRTNHGQAHIEFEGVGPSDTMFSGAAAVRFVFPTALAWSQRRSHPRIPVPAAASLRCVADRAGVTPFEARVVDISLGGLGGMIYDAAIKLEPGTVLKGCRIMIPGGKAISADLEVRYSTSILQSDGSFARRSGVRFVTKPAGIEELVKVFIRDLDRNPDPDKPVGG